MKRSAAISCWLRISADRASGALRALEPLNIPEMLVRIDPHGSMIDIKQRRSDLRNAVSGDLRPEILALLFAFSLISNALIVAEGNHRIDP